MIIGFKPLREIKPGDVLNWKESSNKTREVIVKGFFGPGHNGAGIIGTDGLHYWPSEFVEELTHTSGTLENGSHVK